MTIKMKKINLLVMLALTGSMLMLTSCKEDDDDDNDKGGGDSTGALKVNTVTLDASSYTDWTYFSFGKGEVVSVSDFSTSTGWDIAFHRSDVRVNCGASGPGQGGTYATGQSDFEAVATAPESGYSLNGMIEVAVDISAMPPKMETVPGDSILSGWVEYSMGQGGPTYTYSEEIYIVRTAEGKYVKVWLKDYFNDNSESGHVTMKYAYQSDGSTDLSE